MACRAKYQAPTADVEGLEEADPTVPTVAAEAVDAVEGKDVVHEVEGDQHPIDYRDIFNPMRGITCQLRKRTKSERTGTNNTQLPLLPTTNERHRR